jgi:AmmeMemoRadiSam system protein B/AmmeMemoRadiSam system protein A
MRAAPASRCALRLRAVQPARMFSRGLACTMSFQSTRLVRPPAVAGAFYPGYRKELARDVERLLAGASPPARGKPRALIAPHAGYAYSGPTAAHAFKLLAGVSFRRVCVLGPSHFAQFAGASLPASDAYATPLGEVPIAPLARQLAGRGPLVLEPRCRVQRPPWGRSVPPGEATPDTWEHAIEVEIPFLQRTLGEFELLPVVYGDVDPAQVARELDPLLDDDTLLIVSTDLSHYHSYLEAQALDQSCVEAICALDEARLAAEEACGRLPVQTLLHLAKQRGWQAQLLDLRNSGDTSGDRSRVVGYAAIAFFEGGDAGAGTQRYHPRDRAFLLRLARQTIERVTRGDGLPGITPTEVPPACREQRACFVTLHLGGRLRGCIGNLNASQPLHRDVMRNARDAALRDARFPPVAPEEVSQLRLEISVLTEPQALAFESPADLLQKLCPLRDGVVLQLGGRRATFLPQVWEQLPDPAEFLSHLARKAGAGPGDWQSREARILTYSVEHFAEPA